jgi:hypothetical protein
MEWSPPALGVVRCRISIDWSVRHCWFGVSAAKEIQMEPSTIAIDLAKRVFQIHYVDPQTGAIHSKAL